MLTAALLELLPDRDKVIGELNALGIPGVEMVCEKAQKCGIGGTHMSVRVHGEEESEEMHDHAHTHHHSGLHEIEHIVGALPLSGRIQKDILAVFGMIAEAESHVHGVPVTEIHFHEVGTMDAVADITAVCVLMDRQIGRASCRERVYVLV